MKKCHFCKRNKWKRRSVFLQLFILRGPISIAVASRYHVVVTKNRNVSTNPLSVTHNLSISYNLQLAADAARQSAAASAAAPGVGSIAADVNAAIRRAKSKWDQGGATQNGPKRAKTSAQMAHALQVANRLSASLGNGIGSRSAPKASISGGLNSKEAAARLAVIQSQLKAKQNP